jgi:carboxymethylenebutenolidase
MTQTFVIRAALAAALGACLAGRAASQTLPAMGDSATARLTASPRHGEWVKVDAGGGDTVNTWVVYPERRDKAPVVVVIHEIFGLTDWIRGVADQLAADGFIAIAPDLLSGHGPNRGGSESVDQQGAVRLIRDVTPAEAQRRLMAAGRYGAALPAAKDRIASVGFCWGGSTSFALATVWPELKGAVVYYGTSPDSAALADVRARVLGLYAGDDARVGATVPGAQREMERLRKPFEVHSYEGAGHGYLRDQAGREGANARATAQAWPRTIAFLREVLGR